MATIKIYETPNKIIRLDKDTAEYVLEKVKEAVIDTLNNDTKYIIASNGDVIGDRQKSTSEMFETFMYNLQDILNEIKGDEK